MKTRANKLMLLGLTCGLAASTAAFTTNASTLVVYAEEEGPTEEEIAQAQAEAEAAAAAQAEAEAAAAAQAEAEAAAAAQAEAEAAAAAQAEAEAAAAQAEAEAATEAQVETETAEDTTETAETQADTEDEQNSDEQNSEDSTDQDSGLINLEEADVQVSMDGSYAYTGNPIEPDPVVVVNGVTIGRDVDYVLTYEDNVNVGNAAVRISGQGNYVGEISIGFSIIETEEEAAGENAVSALSFTFDEKEYTNIGDAKVSGIDSAYVYTGEAITPSPVVTLGEETLKEGTAYSLSFGENVEVGEATVTISGIEENGYIGDFSLHFSILETEEEATQENENPSKTNIKDAEVNGFEEGTYTYTGEEITIEDITLKLDDEKLVEGEDYSITYDSNTEVGIGSFTITGMGDYVGSVTYYFAIEKPEDEGTNEDLQEVKTEEEEPAYEIIGFSVDPSAYPAANASANTRYIYNYLTNTMGLNHAAACGVLANIQMESGFNPLALGDGGTSYGICQWHNERFNSLISYCNSIGLDYNTLDGQLANLSRELSGAYYGILAYISSVPNTAQGAYDAGYYWCVNFEIPNDATSHGALRGNLAANNYFPLDLSSAEEAEEEEEDPISSSSTDRSLQPEGWADSAEEFTFTERVLTNSTFQ